MIKPQEKFKNKALSRLYLHPELVEEIAAEFGCGGGSGDGETLVEEVVVEVVS